MRTPLQKDEVAAV